MTFLELVNACRRECGGSGGQPVLTTLGGALSYENARFKAWVAEAWTDIQTKHRTWTFMEREFTFQATAGVQQYTAATLSTPLTSFANWNRKTFRCYNTATGYSDEQLLPFLDWDTFRNLYKYGTMRTTQQRPVVYTIDPLKKILLGPLPDATYTIEGWYYKAPQNLSADTDVPELDEEFHMLIVYLAMEKYGFYEAAPEVLQRARSEGGPLMAQLEMDYLPQITMGAPLA